MGQRGNRSNDLNSQILRKYLKDISQFPMLTPEEEKDLGRRIRGGDAKALQTLIESNLRFVVAFAKKYRGWGMSFQDLINEGNLGLIEASKRFDPDKGTRFITYAVWWIRQAIMHALSEQGGSFRIPQKQANILINIHRTITAMTPKLERRPTPTEVADELDLPREQVETLMRTQTDDVPLEANSDSEVDFNMIDKLEQSHLPPIDHKLLEDSFKRFLGGMMKNLGEKERQVLELRYGLSEEDPRTLKEIGDIVGLSRERVRQIETQALKKLKQQAKGKQLMWYLN